MDNRRKSSLSSKDTRALCVEPWPTGCPLSPFMVSDDRIRWEVEDLKAGVSLCPSPPMYYFLDVPRELHTRLLNRFSRGFGCTVWTTGFKCFPVSFCAFYLPVLTIFPPTQSCDVTFISYDVIFVCCDVTVFCVMSLQQYILFLFVATRAYRVHPLSPLFPPRKNSIR